MKPNMYLCCGLPGSGKTSYSKAFAEKTGIIYLSPDDYYAKINNDEKDRSHKFEIWHQMFYDIHKAEIEKKDVIIDTQALLTIDRLQFMRWFPDFYHHLIIMIADFDLCLINNKNRDRVISEDYMEELFDKWHYPEKEEFLLWDTVTEIVNECNELSIQGIYMKGDYAEYEFGSK